MKQRLRDAYKARNLRDTLRQVQSDIEKLFWLLRNANSSTSDTASSGGSSFTIDTVETLPEIPTDPGTGRFVFWTSEGSGTGDDQIWVAYEGQSRWYPLQKYTTENGDPPA